MAPEKLQKLLVRTALLASVVIVVCLTFYSEMNWKGYWGYAEQPIPFPHNKHVAAGIQCQYCHRGASTEGYQAGVPSVTDCYQCHRGMVEDGLNPGKPESLRPGVKTLIKDYVEQRRDVEWFKYYDMPEHVKFPHKAHINAGLECTECHGNVENFGYETFKMKQKPTMGWCVSCHRSKGASQDCTACHR